MNQIASFLRRWSRLKLQSSAPPALQGAEAAGLESEFGAFLNPEVGRDVRQAALRRLFMTDHYRTMDGLDVYVSDYSKPELLASQMLDKLDHARGLIGRDDPEPENPAQGFPQKEPSE